MLRTAAATLIMKRKPNTNWLRPDRWGVKCLETPRALISKYGKLMTLDRIEMTISEIMLKCKLFLGINLPFGAVHK